MKNRTSSLVFALLALSLFSCKRHKYYRKDDGFATEVNYPVAFVVNGEGNSLALINLQNNMVKETYALKGGTFPHHIYMNTDKTMMAIAFTNMDLSGGHGASHSAMSKYMVQVFNTTTGKHITNIILKNMAHNAVFSPDGSELWVGQASSDKSQVYVYDTKKWKCQKKIDVDKDLAEITFSKNGTKAYATNTGANNVSIINVSDKNVVTTITLGTTPVGAWPASNGKMYADNEGTQTVSEIDVATNAVTATINLGFKPGYVAYNDAKKELWVSDATNGKVVYYMLVANVWTVAGSILTGADAHAIAFNNDESKAYVTNQGANSVSVIDVNTHLVTNTITVSNKPNGIAIKQ
ncbi:MAG: YncE family protein [Bacteroidia bacterium]|nr:YncE family protein [Bacteroidia bacterium]